MLLSGALPVEWQAMTLQILNVVGNGLNGTLPTGCVTSPPVASASPDLHGPPDLCALLGKLWMRGIQGN